MEAVQVLHLGCVSSVFLASRPGAGQEQKIVKAYHKSSLQVRHWLNITREVANLRHLKELGVPGIVDLCGTADDATNVYLVFEPCAGGDLYKRLSHRGLLSEGQLCREVIAPLLRVLHSLHQLGIIHRDIKPENIFFEGDGSLRLGDFGLAINAARERPISRVGTLDYMAPEVLAQPSADVVAQRCIRASQLPSYTSKVDVWSVGVLVYEALMGVTPFSDSDPQLAALKAQFRLPLPLHGGVTPACADFVARALTKQADRRPSALQLLGHPWVRAHADDADAAPAPWPRAVTPTDHMAAGAMQGGSRTPIMAARVPGAPIPITKSMAPAHARSSSGGSSTGGSAPLSCSAPTSCMPASLQQGLASIAKPAAAATGAAAAAAPPPPKQQPPAQCHLVSPKQQPQQHKPQQLPPHPFATAAQQGVMLECRAQSSPVVLCDDDGGDGEGAGEDAGGAARLQGPGPDEAQQDELLLGPSSRHVSIARRFVRQLSSPVPVKGAPVQQQDVLPQPVPGETPSSPTPSRLSVLAASPVRALIGAAGRHLMRQRSGAPPPGEEGAATAAAAAAAAAASVRQGGQSGFLLRSPLPSPIRGLLQQRRRQPPAASASASASLLAAAQWRPPGCGSAGSGGGVCCSAAGIGNLHPAARGPAGSSSNSNSSSKCCDCSSLLRACSLGPATLLGAGLATSSSCGSSTASGGQQEPLLPAAAGSLPDGNNGHAARTPEAADGPCGAWRSSGGQQAPACGRALALSRYPSAPDPGPLLLAVSPIRAGGVLGAAAAGAGGGAPAGRPGALGAEQHCRLPPQQLQLAGPLPAAASGADAAPDQRPPSGLQGVKGMWVKVQGMCRMVARHVAVEEDDLAGDADCLVGRGPP